MASEDVDIPELSSCETPVVLRVRPAPAARGLEALEFRHHDGNFYQRMDEDRPLEEILLDPLRGDEIRADLLDMIRDTIVKGWNPWPKGIGRCLYGGTSEDGPGRQMMLLSTKVRPDPRADGRGDHSATCRAAAMAGVHRLVLVDGAPWLRVEEPRLVVNLRVPGRVDFDDWRYIVPGTVGAFLDRPRPLTERDMVFSCTDFDRAFEAAMALPGAPRDSVKRNPVLEVVDPSVFAFDFRSVELARACRDFRDQVERMGLDGHDRLSLILGMEDPQAMAAELDAFMPEFWQAACEVDAGLREGRMARELALWDARPIEFHDSRVPSFV